MRFKHDPKILMEKNQRKVILQITSKKSLNARSKYIVPIRMEKFQLEQISLLDSRQKEVNSFESRCY